MKSKSPNENNLAKQTLLDMNENAKITLNTLNRSGLREVRPVSPKAGKLVRPTDIV